VEVREGQGRRVGGGPEKLVTLEEAARLLKVPADDVEQMIREGRVPSFRLGGNLLRLRLRDVEALVPVRAGRGKPARRPEAGSGLLDRVRDFFYFNDFYLIAFLLLLTLLAVIFSL